MTQKSTRTSDVVSVIVPTKNSEPTLAACLESIRRQTYRPLELVVVDNASSDATAAIARRLADTVLQGGPERSAQRNLGAAASSGTYLLMIDSDMVLDERVVEDCVDAAVGDGLSAVVIPERSVGSGFWAACKALERSCYVGDDTIEAARFFTREDFERHGGYDEQMTGAEDWDLPARMRSAGASVGRVSAQITHLEGNLRLRDTLAKKFYYGRSSGPYLRRHPALARGQITPFRRAFVVHRKRLSRTPLLSAGMLAMKVAELAAAGFGYASARLGLHPSRPGS